MSKRILRTIVGVTAVMTVLAGCKSEKPYEKPLTAVKLKAVEMHTPGAEVRYSANIRPASQVELAFRVGGYIQEIHQVSSPGARRRDVQEGDKVARGTVLARIRDSDFRAKVQQAESQVAAAKASHEAARHQLTEVLAGVEHARLELERATKLFATQSITKPDFDGAKARLESLQAKSEAARSQVEATQAIAEGAKAQLQEAEIALRDCSLTAPMDSVVLRRSIETASLVGPGFPAFVLADTTSVKAVFGVPDLIVQNYRLAQPQSFTAEAFPGVEFRGRVTRIAPSADPKSRVFEVELTAPNPKDQLKVGMISSLRVTEKKESETVPVVPLTAVVRPKGESTGYAVYVVEQQGDKHMARIRKVKLGEALGNMIALTEGVNAGEQVIVAGANLVVDGEQVRVIP